MYSYKNNYPIEDLPSRHRNEDGSTVTGPGTDNHNKVTAASASSSFVVEAVEEEEETSAKLCMKPSDVVRRLHVLGTVWGHQGISLRSPPFFRSVAKQGGKTQ